MIIRLLHSRIIIDFELSPEGSGYRARTRFAKFCNLSEPMSMFKEVADIKTADTLDLPRPKRMKLINQRESACCKEGCSYQKANEM